MKQMKRREFENHVKVLLFCFDFQFKISHSVQFVPTRDATGPI